jgi:hypothetical protein
MTAAGHSPPSPSRGAGRLGPGFPGLVRMNRDACIGSVR